MEWECELPLRSDRYFLFSAAARELNALLAPAQVVLDVSGDRLEERLERTARPPVGHALGDGVVKGEDGWPRVKVHVVLDDRLLPDGVADALRAGRVGIGWDADCEPHRCPNDDAHTMIAGFSKLRALAIVPMGEGSIEDDPDL